VINGNVKCQSSIPPRQDQIKSKADGLVKSRKDVTPAKAGVQNNLKLLDSRFRGNDKNGSKLTFYESIKDGFLLAQE